MFTCCGLFEACLSHAAGASGHLRWCRALLVVLQPGELAVGLAGEASMRVPEAEHGGEPLQLVQGGYPPLFEGLKLQV